VRFFLRCHLKQVCKEIEKTINSTIQSTLNTLEKDCSDIACKIDRMIEEDKYDLLAFV